MRWRKNSLLLTCLLLCLIGSAAAETFKPIRTIDLKSELCEPKFQQENIPMAGVAFVTDDDVLVYTVCHVNVALSLRGRFQETDPYHLKAVIVDASTGAIRKRFDLPTHSHESAILITHEGNLLIHRDNLLELFDPEGKRLAASRIDRTGLYVFIEVSATSHILNLVDFTDTFDGKPNAVTILDSRNLSVISQWHDDADSMSIASSPEITVRTVASGSILVMRTFTDTQWTTLLKEAPSGIQRPIFVSDSEFAVPVLSQGAVLVFKASGKVLASLKSPSSIATAVSRDGHMLGVVWGGNHIFVGPDGHLTVPQNGARLFELPSLNEVGSLSFSPTPMPGFRFALSPHSKRLAILDQLNLSIMETPVK